MTSAKQAAVLTDMPAAIVRLEDMIWRLDKKVNDLVAKAVTHMQGRMEPLTISMQQQAARMVSTEKTAEELAATVGSLYSTVNALVARVTDMEQRIQNQQSEICAMKTTPAWLQNDKAQTAQQASWSVVPPRSVERQFKVTGVFEKPDETDRELAEAVKRTIMEKLDDHEAYRAKEDDKVEFTVDRVRRMGKGHGDKPRVVHVTVMTQLDASSLVRNRRFLKDSGVSILDFLTPEELLNHKKNLPAFLEARKDVTKWATLRRGELQIKDRVPPRLDAPISSSSYGVGGVEDMPIDSP